MRIVMMTNTYLPHVGGVARSVESFTEVLREHGHDVLVATPKFDDGPENEEDVIRVPAIQNFNGSDFAVRLPIPAYMSSELDRFGPQIVHSHHPFLMGDTALRTATGRSLPLVFTHHTMYERYTHYVPGDSDLMKGFAIRMATQYANLCDQVIAPSESIAKLLRKRGVTAPIEPLPTGIDPRRLAEGDGAAVRERLDIPREAFVVGHVGRLAEEKNLGFLCDTIVRFLSANAEAHFVLVGDGPLRESLDAFFTSRNLSSRAHMTGKLTGQDVADAYHAMDVFAFASQTETQGMVLAESMTAGVPVVAVDAPGVREVVQDGENGFLLQEEDASQFAEALTRLADQDASRRESMREAARRTAKSFSLDRCTKRLIAIYEALVEAGAEPATDHDPWEEALRRLETEWSLWSKRVVAAARSATSSWSC